MINISADPSFMQTAFFRSCNCNYVLRLPFVMCSCDMDDLRHIGHYVVKKETYFLTFFETLQFFTVTTKHKQNTQETGQHFYYFHLAEGEKALNL